MNRTHFSDSVILIVDDDAAHRALTRRAIASECPGAAILEAQSLSEARHILQSKGAALKLVLLDINMDQECGLDLLRSIRADSSTSQLQVVILSTSALDSDIEASFLNGADRFLTKNSDPQAYQREIREMVASYLKSNREPKC